MVNSLLGVVALVSTWRFFACAALGVAAAFFAAAWVPEGVQPYVVLAPLLALGVIIGAVWQSRHERNRKPVNVRQA